MENKTENKLSFILITCILYAKNYSSRYRCNIYYTQNIIPKTLATNVHKTETLRDIRSESNKLIKWDSNTVLSVQERKKTEPTYLIKSLCKNENSNIKKNMLYI